jgi:2-keto-4-pentenoate hydratase/2-oxohepta-3-ene-1,7-dioic acid hydratase in catechol pathway
MKYLQHRTDAGVVPALLDGDVVHDVAAHTDAITGAFLASGDHEAVRAAAAAGALPRHALADVVLEPPIARPSKIVCIGLNYRDHAAETGAAIPAEPVVFMKDPGTIVPADATVLIPRGSVKTDWEVELGVVIGAEARYLDSPEAAAAVIGGYVLSHDVSEREFQIERGGQWDKGKSCETFNPLGPFVATADEIGDPQALGLRLWVNDELKQDGTTADMIFGVHHVVHYLSQFMVLRPGDLINTGTPAGVALGQPDPKPYLRAGDVVALEIDGLGRAVQTLAQA